MTNPGTPPPTASVSGQVTHQGAPLAGATVSIFETNINSIVQTAQTGADGRYSFTGLLAAGNVTEDYQVWVRKAGYGFQPSCGAYGTVTRADYTGQFQGNGVTDTAIYFTVIDYPAAAATPLSTADFTAFDGSAGRVRLARTGQAASYAAGDDGALARGVAWSATRFTDNQDGTVTDQLTGLVWLKDAGALGTAAWSGAVAAADALADGQAGLHDGSRAGDWRLPNLNELESLVDVSASQPALPAGHPFLQVGNGIYWTSTSYFGGQGGSPNAWAIRLGDGRWINDSVNNLKTSAANGIWAVRGAGGGAAPLAATGAYVSFAPGDDGDLRLGVPAPWPRFVDGGDGTVHDTLTGLTWLKRADAFDGLTWNAALAAVNALGNGQSGLADGSAPGDWRLPNRTELLSLGDRAMNNHADFFDQSFIWAGALFQPAIFQGFQLGGYYWTSSTDAADASRAWAVYSCDFGVYDLAKAGTGPALAVR
jgi:hypothetical protein